MRAILDPGASAPFSQWFWAENSERAGALSMYRNPGDGFGTGCTTWGVMTTCLPFGEGPDLMFSLGGRQL